MKGRRLDIDSIKQMIREEDVIRLNGRTAVIKDDLSPEHHQLRRLFSGRRNQDQIGHLTW